MGWPRGKYNGQRIVGFEIKVICDVTWWRLKWPDFKYGSCGCIGPFRFWFSASYER